MNALLITLAVLAVPPAQRATAMGVYQAIYALGMLAGPWVAGLLAGTAGLPAMFVVSALVGAAGAGLAVLLRRTHASE
jgi:predicted MFS family arabinose efflux permease